MAQRVHLSDCSDSMRDAHNANHASMSSGYVHYDGPDYQPDQALTNGIGQTLLYR